MNTLLTVNPIPFLFKSETKSIRNRPITKTICVCTPSPSGFFYIGKGINTLNSQQTRCTLLIIPISTSSYTILKIDLHHNCCVIYNADLEQINFHSNSSYYSLKGFREEDLTKVIIGKCTMIKLI